MAEGSQPYVWIGFIATQLSAIARLDLGYQIWPHSGGRL